MANDEHPYDWEKAEQELALIIPISRYTRRTVIVDTSGPADGCVPALITVASLAAATYLVWSEGTWRSVGCLVVGLVCGFTIGAWRR